jgi:hypothetical protein
VIRCDEEARMPELRSADVMVDALLGNEDTIEKLRTDPAPTLREAAAEAKRTTPLNGDVWVYRMVVGFLGGVVTIVAVGLIVLSFVESKSTPEGLIALGSAAVGALAGLLAPAPSR